MVSNRSMTHFTQISRVFHEIAVFGASDWTPSKSILALAHIIMTLLGQQKSCFEVKQPELRPASSRLNLKDPEGDGLQ